MKVDFRLALTPPSPPKSQLELEPIHQLSLIALLRVAFCPASILGIALELPATRLCYCPLETKCQRFLATVDGRLLVLLSLPVTVAMAVSSRGPTCRRRAYLSARTTAAGRRRQLLDKEEDELEGRQGHQKGRLEATRTAKPLLNLFRMWSWHPVDVFCLLLEGPIKVGTDQIVLLGESHFGSFCFFPFGSKSVKTFWGRQ